MTKENEPESVGERVGRRLRQYREADAMTQDELARFAGDMGLSGWTRSTVAAIEAGRRRLDAGELLLLPHVIWRTFGVDVNLAKLLDDDGPLRLTDTAVAHSPAIRSAIAGGIGRVPAVRRTVPADVETPWSRSAGDHLRPALEAIGRNAERTSGIVKAIWPGASFEQAIDAEHDMTGEAEQKAARKLRVSALAVSLAAHRLWGQSLTAERDMRVTTIAEGMSPRTQQAMRGRVTRRLLDDIAPLVKEVRE